jgi:hypothetical protein
MAYDQDHFVIQGGTVYAGEPTYQAHGELPHAAPGSWQSGTIQKYMDQRL